MADEKPHLHVEFYTEPVENPKESAKQGRPIFEDKEFVFVQIAGDPKNTFRAPAHSKGAGGITYAERFPDHYRLFKLDQDQQGASGTPLSEVPWLSAARREELKALKIFTVEALAQLDGSLLQRIGMGARELKNKAQAWLDSAADHAGEARLAEELAARDAVIDELRQQMAELMAGRQTGLLSSEPVDPSPFNGWDDGALRQFIEEQSGKKPHHLLGRAKLVQMAEELHNAEAEAA